MTGEIPQAEKPVLLCNLAALEAAHREQHMTSANQVFAAVQERRELPVGYAFRLSEEDITLLQGAQFLTNERRCCPFFHFTLSIEPEGGAVWLSLTAKAGVKAVGRAQFGEQSCDRQGRGCDAEARGVCEPTLPARASRRIPERKRKKDASNITICKSQNLTLLHVL